MSKKTYMLLTTVYFILLIGSLAIYAVNVADENWTIDLEKELNNILVFFFLAIIGFVLAAIGAAGTRDSEKKIGEKAIYGGFGIAGFFLVWRLINSIF